MQSLSWRRKPSLQTRIGAPLGVLILAMSVAFAALMYRGAEKQVLVQSAANIESLSRQMARELSIGMDRFAQAVQTQTYRERFHADSTSVPLMREALDQFLRTNPEFAYVSIIDVASSRVLAASGGIFEGGDASGRPTFEQGRNGLFVGDVHDAVRLAELLPKPSNGEPLRFLDVAAPILDADGRVFRVFATHIAWQWTDTLRRDVFGPVQAANRIDAILLDAQGKVVLAATPGLKVGTPLPTIFALSGRPAAVVEWPDGGEYLTVVSETAPHGYFPGFGWKVVSRQSLAVATAPASELRDAFLVGSLLLGLGGAALGWFFTGRLVRPVRQLAEDAVQASGGVPVAQPASGGRAATEVSVVKSAIAHLADTARLHAAASQLSRRQFAALADSLPQVVLQTDAAGVVEYTNHAWVIAGGPNAEGRADGNGRAAGTAALASPSPKRLEGLAPLVVEEDRERFESGWRAALASGDPLDVRCRMAPTGGAPRWHDVQARAVRSDDGTTTHWVATIFDIHGMMVRAEDAGVALQKERTARLEAERVARLRDEFLATVSHELRSPLSVITGWSDILRRKGSDNPMVVKAADIIRSNSRLQAALIDDLLDITAVMAGKLTLNAEYVDLSRVARDAVLSHLHAAQTKGVALLCSAELPCFVDADRRRMTQVVANLLGNALKFTEAGGSVEVSVRAEDDRALLAVADTGRGIAPEFLPHVFERMRQEDASTTRRVGGLGLGLAIVEGLVSLHGGTASAHSAGTGQGSRFTVALPLSRGLADSSAPAIDRDADETVIELQGRRVLLVDDEADAREVAQVALSSLGAEVRTASSGAEVLRILEGERFDVLVSDIGMPGMDGLTLLRAIRRMEAGTARALPAVALTAFAMESDRLAGLSAGFQAYVAKPISLRRLSEAVAHAMHAATRN